MNRTIRHANPEDLPRMLELIEFGRQKMRAIGNMNQWINGYPRPEQLLQDIREGNSYLVEEDGVAIATFAFVKGPDVTYNKIFEGRWLDEPEEDSNSQKSPKTDYHVIHRMASAPDVRGIMKFVLDYCFNLTSDIRIDTHRQNITMQRVLEKNGFQYCGIIYLLDGAERLAYCKAVEKV
ncbi:MAG: N-acetyltransferase [Prevotella sp.]|nr:N-acetyltransferase [Prevotella sp.]